MSGAFALRDSGPSGWCRAALCVCLIGGAMVGGCAPPSAPLSAVPPHVAPEPDEEELSILESALSRRAGSPDSVAAATMRAAGLTPLFERRFVVDNPAGPLVAGLLPGGHPVFRDSLVVVMALGPKAGAALLAAAGWITERAAYHPGAARTIMAALSFTGATIESDATTVLTRTLSVPLWDPARVSGIVLLGAGAGSAAGAAAQRGLALTVVDDVPGSSTSALALRAYAAMLEVAGGSELTGRDTVTTRG